MPFRYPSKSVPPPSRQPGFDSPTVKVPRRFFSAGRMIRTRGNCNGTSPERPCYRRTGKRPEASSPVNQAHKPCQIPWKPDGCTGLAGANHSWEIKIGPERSGSSLPANSPLAITTGSRPKHLETPNRSSCQELHQPKRRWCPGPP